jgi:vesicle-associated membrane protein 7
MAITKSSMEPAVRQSEILHFLYALIINEGNALAEYSATDDLQGHTRQDVISEVSKIPLSTARAVGEMGKCRLFVLTESEGIRYICLAHSTTSDANGFDFLTTIQTRWVRVNGAGSTAANPRFGQTDMAAQVRSYNSTQFDKIALIKDNLREAQIETTKNLELALERGEAIDVMSSKAESLRDSAQTFHREATHLKRQMCIEKWKWHFIGVAVAVVVLFAIVWIICGVDFGKC